MCEELPFDPFPLIRGSHGQTIIGSFLNLTREPSSETRYVPLSDGDELALEVTTPENWNPNGGITLIMIHGLCGSHKSGYLIRMTRRLMQKGVRCVRMNLRGCGTGFGHARHIYHSGRSEDLHEAIKFLEKEAPNSPFVIMGFSLGGNIALKLAGELNSHAKGQIQQFISICPPTDLFSSVKRVNEPANRFYERYFIRLLKASARRREKFYPDVPKVRFPRRLSLQEFDEMYTAPLSGFKDSMDYYERCSSKPLIPEISVDCRILFSKDDPIIAPEQLDDITLPDNVILYKTDKGGHLGYLSTRKKGGFHWMDHILEEWILGD